MATIEVVFVDGNNDGQPPALIGFRTGPSASDPPAFADGSIACAPLVAPVSPTTRVCSKDSAIDLTVYAVVEGDGPTRAIGPVTITAATPFDE